MGEDYCYLTGISPHLPLPSSRLMLQIYFFQISEQFDRITFIGFKKTFL